MVAGALPWSLVRATWNPTMAGLTGLRAANKVIIDNNTKIGLDYKKILINNYNTQSSKLGITITLNNNIKYSIHT